MDPGRLGRVVVVCGEALVDLVPAPGGHGHLARPGGSPANVAVALARLGRPAHLLARLATDHFGQLVRAHVSRSGVDLSLAVATPQRCSVVLVGLDPAGTPDYTFFVDGGADDGWRVEDLPAALPAGAALHVSGALALARPGLRATVDALLRREAGGRLISFDPNPRPHLGLDRTALRDWVARADLVKVSVEDLAFTEPGRAAEDVVREWATLGPALVVLTRGADGVSAFGPDGWQHQPAEPVTVVDSVGAGDAFVAGLLAALPEQGRLTPASLRRITAAEVGAALRLAQRVAALTCARAGADPPTRAELDVHYGQSDNA